MTVTFDVALLAVSVASVWLASAAICRLRAPADAIHAVSFVFVAPGVALAAAVVLHEGAGATSLKMLFLLGCALLNGGALSHASGRALLLRARAERDAG